MEPEARFKIDELAEATDLSRRTIHHYIAQGLIPRAKGGAGPAAYYDEEHYLRLRLLALMKAMGLSLSSIRNFLDHLSLEEMRDVLEQPEELASWSIWERLGTPSSWGSGRESEPRARRSQPGEDLSEDVLRQDTDQTLFQSAAVESAPPPTAAKSPRRAHWRRGSRSRGSIRRDAEFVASLSEEHGSKGEGPDVPDESILFEDSLCQEIESPYDRNEDEEPSAFLMSSPTSDDLALPEESLHPEMESRPWRRVRVSSDLEINYRPSSDPLTRKKLGHLLDFVHRLFRLERSAEGLTPDVLTTQEGPAGRRTPDNDSESPGGPRAPGERPEEEES